MNGEDKVGDEPMTIEKQVKSVCLITAKENTNDKNMALGDWHASHRDVSYDGARRCCSVGN
ncbi:hypothetical protein THZG08_110099 [Vibrio owensii]|nr:hypothetical protein THZG08_110099 [Vibrio owensii]CAH1550232.1 hypothetical protein THOA03_110100 [Vibrio owensii]